MNKKLYPFLVTGLSSFLAAGFHVFLTWEHFEVKFGLGSTASSLCQVSEAFDCAAVAASPYSSLLGIPMALFGFWIQIIILILSFHYHFRSKSQTLSYVTHGSILFGLSAISFGASVIMGSISLFMLNTFCTFCIATYFLSAVTFWGAWKMIFSSHQPFKINVLPKPLSWSWAYLSIPLMAWASHALIIQTLGAEKLPILVQESLHEWRAQEKTDFAISPGIVFGKSDQATHTLIEFIDLFCPHCAHASGPLKAYVKSHPNTQLVVKIFPLDGQCNPGLSPHDGLRCQWAYALMCAQNKDQGPQALEWILDRQKELYGQALSTGIEQMAADLKLNQQELLDCMQTDATKTVVTEMSNEGHKGKIQGTPALFVNGKLLPRAQLLPVLDAAITDKGL